MKATLFGGNKPYREVPDHINMTLAQQIIMLTVRVQTEKKGLDF